MNNNSAQYWMKPKKIKTEDMKYWAKARVLFDYNTNQQYVDVLCGRKNSHDPHIHAGFEINTHLPLFIESRNITTKVKREILNHDGEIKREELILKNSKGEKDFRISFGINHNTKEVTISEFSILPVNQT